MKTAKNGLIWSALERVLTQGIQLLIMLILARRLGPEAFGLIGMIAIFLAISQVFVDSGFSSAVIRKQDRNEKDYATVFIFNIVVSFACYGGLWLSAPYIANFYGKTELIDITRVIGLVIPINALAIVQRIRLTVTLDFKRLAIATFIGALVSGTIAITFAYFMKLGVWALVYQSLSFALVSTIALNIMNVWYPRERFCLQSFNHLFGFGSKLLLASLIETISSNAYSLIIGKKFSASSLGLYTQANQLSSVPAITMTNILQRVTYPLLSNIQDDNKRLDETYLLIIRMSCFIVFPVMSLLAIMATPLLTFLIGDIWWKASILLTVLVCGYILYPLHSINLNLLQVKGRSDLFLRLEMIKKVGMLLILLISINYSILAVCIGATVSSYFSLFVNTYYTGKLSSITLKKQIVSLLPNWLICMFFIALSLIINYFYKANSFYILLGISIIFCISYGLCAFTLQKDIMLKMLTFFKKRS